MLTFEQALSLVKDKIAGAGISPCPETLPLDQARGRVLAEDVAADRDYPPFHRSTRDGYAVRSADVKTAPVSLECVGEARAGKPWPGTLRERAGADRKSTRLNSSHSQISYAVFCLKKKKINNKKRSKKGMRLSLEKCTCMTR